MMISKLTPTTLTVEPFLRERSCHLHTKRSPVNPGKESSIVTPL
jgi:hypothetical protein